MVVPRGTAYSPRPVAALKYPKTPYWPWSPSIGRDDRVLRDPSVFVGPEVVVTEKLDGGNTLLHRGQVYARSVSTPSSAAWMAMVRKHHAWKVTEPNVLLYGEDLYGVHSIEYDPMPEDQTFRAFALRTPEAGFACFDDLKAYADARDIPVAPTLFRGRFDSVSAIRRFLETAHRQPSVLGGEREGMVLRPAGAFQEGSFGQLTAKSVRANHVQTDRHWTRNWRPCQLLRATATG